jgi:hypothetical protein
VGGAAVLSYRGGCVLRPILGDVVYDDAGALGCEASRDGAADAASSAGDDGNLTAQARRKVLIGHDSSFDWSGGALSIGEIRDEHQHGCWSIAQANL